MSSSAHAYMYVHTVLRILSFSLSPSPPSPPLFFSHSVVRELIRYKHATIQDKDEDSNSPLHIACIHGHVGVAKVLIAANCDIKERFGHIVLSVPSLFSILFV